MKYKIFFSLLALFLFSAFTTKKDMPVTIFMIGDSTMADRDVKKGNMERGWGQMLPRFFTDDILIDNHAACGRSTRSFINEGRWQTVLGKLKEGDYVIIQFGHNDEKTDTVLHTVPGGSFDDNLRKFVGEARGKGAKPILMNSIVRRNYPPAPNTRFQYVYEKEGKILVNSHGEYINSPRKVAQEMNVPFVDMTRLTHELVSKMGPEKSKELFMWVPAGKYARYPKGKTDNTHLNIYGSKVIARIAAEAIAEAVPELAEYIRHYDPEIYVADYKDNKKCAISYTFDDGLEEHYTMVYPQLETLGFKGTFWVCGKIIEYKDANLGKPRMSWKQMKEMSDKGHEISNHSWSHPNLKHLDKEKIREEIDKNDSIILFHTGKKPRTFCYPGNSYDKRVEDITSEGRTATRTKQYAIGGEVAKSTPQSLSKWVDELLVAEEWGVTMTHGITYGYDCFSNSETLWNHLSKVKEQENEIWVDTFAKIGAYIKERKNIQLDIVKNKSSYKVTPHLALAPELFPDPLTMVMKNGGNKSKIKVKQDRKQLPVKTFGDETLFDFNPYGGTIDISF